MRYPLIVANWKLNGSEQVLVNFIQELQHKLNDDYRCKIIIAPPLLYLSSIKSLLVTSNICLCAQNVDIHLCGSFTGEISVVMLKDLGVAYAIIGHSERRRYHNESDRYIAEKFSVLKENGIIPIFCIGENKEEYENGKTKEICIKQIDSILTPFGVGVFQNTIIAYEPIWAIGTGKSAAPSHVQGVHEFIRVYISHFNEDISKNLVLIYGGSVNIGNSFELFSQLDIDGALIGQASLSCSKFIEIINIADKSKIFT